MGWYTAVRNGLGAAYITPANTDFSAHLCPIYCRGYSHCVSREGHGFESLRSPSHTGFFRLAESPSLTLRRHVQETHGLTEGLDRVAHSGITRDYRPNLGLNIRTGSREPDAAYVDAQRDGTRRGVLVEPVAFLHYQQYYVQAPALAQRDGVPTPSPERLLLAQPGNLRAEVERLQRPCIGRSDSGCGLLDISFSSRSTTRSYCP
jgi:hypothetical protein